MLAKRQLASFLLIVAILLLTDSRGALAAAADAFEAKVSALWSEVPPAQTHYDGVAETEASARLRRQQSYPALVREKLQGNWFAALISERANDAYAVQARFETWKGLVDFLAERDALVDVWAYREAGELPRRIPATELAALKKQAREQPTFITVTYRDDTTSELITNRVEFSFQAASQVLAAGAGYRRHRDIQLAAREALGSRDAKGRLSAVVQWEQLTNAAHSGRLPLAELPPRPTNSSDLFVAIEYEVDAFNNFTNAARVYRTSEIDRRVVEDSPEASAQVLMLKRAGESQNREVRSFRVRGLSDELEPAPNPVPGQDVVELRVKNSAQPDVRKWNVLDFGEPALVEQSALARFSLISAHLEKKRKELAIKKSKLDFIAEPIFTGLSVGGGLAGVGFPLGEAARLGYNSTLVPLLIPSVPTVKEMRELFLLMTAKDRHPELKTKPGRFLEAADMKRLQESAKNLTDADVVEYLQHISDEDIAGMLRLAKMQHIDAKVSNLLSVMADAGKVSGWTDESGFQRDVFNSIYFSVTGEVSIKNIIAVLVGAENATPKSGVSLKDLVDGKGPDEAWWQYLNFTVDIRAVVNTIARLSHRGLADKELKKPFPYAPRMTDLSAYELRIFGFPLLIFYKYGLTKADHDAYLNDYAYGLIGATIVEHFRTREEMDEEIRAGRMVPLGYVRVPDGKGGWKETNLAVFGHRIPTGKRKGKTAIVIYGLKAYETQSQLIEREYLRFKQFEQALRDGAVIERLVDAEDRATLPAEAFEPKLSVGVAAAEEIYAPLLGGLQELHRHWKRKSWGAPSSADDEVAFSKTLMSFAERDIRLENRDPLVGVDRFNSTFQFRKLVGDRWRVMQVTLVPGVAELERDAAKGADGERSEKVRQNAVSDRGDGVVLLNVAKQVNGQYEIGPLLQDGNGEVNGFGVRAGAKAMEEMFDRINELPIAERARLQFNNFAATVIDLDVTGAGRAEKVFLTIEFPLDKKFQRAWTNPLSGERETLNFEKGHLTSAITDRRITEIDFSNDGREQASRTFFNTGTRERPVKGALLEETRTLETWARNLSQPGVDPYAPLLSKLKVNHVTGQVSRETYGLFPLPVTTVDDQFITETRFNAFGVFASARVLDNGATDADFQRPLMAKLTQPIVGVERFQLTSTIPQNGLSTLRDLKAQGYQTTVERRDVIKGLSRTIVFDNARGGRKAAESLVDPFDGTTSFTLTNLIEYRDDFLFGIVPSATQLKSIPGGALLSATTVQSFDRSSRQLIAVETDSTGRSSTNVWDYRWASPVLTETTLRRTTNQFDRLEVSVSGTTFSRNPDEAVCEFNGRFDAASQRWTMSRVIVHRPGVAKRTETNTMSSSGKLISTRVAELFESRPTYNADGIETARRTTQRNPANGQFDLNHQLEDDYRWQAGERDARVQLFVAGQPYDSFRSLTDAEGRTIVDRIRQIPGCNLRTVITFAGGSERATSAEETQNGARRRRHITQAERQQPDGSWLLPVASIPEFGLASTQTFLISDLLARPLATTSANGESVRVTEWFEATSIAKTSELLDRQGQPRERFIKSLSQGNEDGIPFDLTEHYQLNPWGGAALAEEEADIRGTDVALFKRTIEEKTRYNFSEPLKIPSYAIDPRMQDGMAVTIGSVRQSNVLSVFRGRLVQFTNTVDQTQRTESALELEAVDLKGLFYHKVTRQIIDQSGRILEETFGRIPNLGATAYTDATLSNAVARVQPTKKLFYHYDRGWLVEQTNSESGRVLTFADKPEGKSFPVNDGPWRDWVTQIDGAQSISDTASEDPLDATASRAYFFRRIHSPRVLERNPYMPDRSDVWRAWTATELRPDKQPLFDAENIYDAQGQLAVSKARKTAGANKLAAKIAFNLSSPAPETLQGRAFDGNGSFILLDLRGQGDFSTSAFVYYYTVSNANALRGITFSDASGVKVRVTKGDSNYRQRIISQWPIGSANVRWLPDAVLPQQGLAVDAPDYLLKDDQLVVISTHDLARAGLNLKQINSVRLEFENRRPISLSPLLSLSGREPWIADETRKELSFTEREHFNGLRTFALAPRKRTEREVLAGRGLNSVSEFNGLPIVITRPTAAHSEYPHTIVVDNSDVDSSRPLYALSPHDGHFLQHYKTLKLGDAQVYTVVQGFEVPRVEVFSARALADEIAPEFMAYGSDYAVTIQYARGRGIAGEALAGLHNRIAANAFTLSGDRLAGVLRTNEIIISPLRRFDYAFLHDANRQADEISQLPMLAEALLPNRELPWPATLPAGAIVVTQEWSVIRRALTESSKLHADYPTGLIPTAPGTEAERYVDTVQEADVIVLAAKVGELALARGVLDFYWEKSQGGQKALHASYDAQAGTAKTAEPTSERPPPALRTAESQLAIADAAFIMGLQTSDAKWLTMGSNLLHVLFEDFHPPPITNGAPRGFCEHQFVPSTNAFGVTFWPRAQLFSLRSNARAYLLFKQLREVLDRRSTDNYWRLHITDALREQEAWLNAYVVPQVERTGVVPKGLFEIQDINQGVTALGVERWTSAEDWLAFIETADAMGISRENTRRWLENLARIHGVRVNHIWGLDWSIPLLRADTISVATTAKFQRLARLLKMDQAEYFAHQNLGLLRAGGSFPLLATAAKADLALQSGQGFFIAPLTNHQGWPQTFSADKELVGPTWDAAAIGPLETKAVGEVWAPRRTDLTVFVLITAGFYLFILASAIFWWRFRALREREHAKVFPDPLVPDTVMQRAEERWAKRVLGVQNPSGSENTRFSNSPLEQNFLLQLKAIYKFVLEWRRHENHWGEDDPRLADSHEDPWLNGLDEFATLTGLYMRWVIKAGAKDGFSKADVLAENEDSNHIWSRLVMYLSEHYWGVLALMRNYQNVVTRHERSSMYGQFSKALGSLGVRQRAEPFDARELFNVPADPAAMDLLAIQRPGMTLDKLVTELSEKLSIPREHIVEFVARYKEFKRRESPYPIHPYLIEFAKVAPHFVLMGLGALIWYNQGIGDSPIVPYLWSVLVKFALNPASLIWALPILGGMLLSFAASWVRVYRFEAPMLAREKTELFLDATLTSIFTKPTRPAKTETDFEREQRAKAAEQPGAEEDNVMPEARAGRRWNPHLYQWFGWALRGFGFTYLALKLLRLETPSFATFLIVKGLLAMLAFAEVAAIVLPLLSTALSKFLQDHVTQSPDAWPITKFINRLNITATKPASPLWLALKYHAQPSMPTGDFWGMTQAVLFYFVLAGTFFFVGGFLCQEIFSLWFTDTYLQAADWKLFFGTLLFWNTMYLLRYGIFLMFSGVASIVATFPFQGVIGLLALAQIGLVAAGPALDIDITSFSTLIYFLMAVALLLIFLGEPITRWLKAVFTFRTPKQRLKEEIVRGLTEIKENKNATLGVVYMSGDDLAFQKLTPNLLMTRWNILRDKLNSSGLRLLCGLASQPDDATLRKWFEDLYESEKSADATLWHPMQLVIAGESPALSPELGLNVPVENAPRRDQLLTAWHLRRWLVTMMSTAGHSQDTAINLVDIALRLNKEGLASHTVFYLIQNKYDNNENNRPSQTPYHTGELNQRNKLARLLKAVAPGCRAYNIHDWTPFGFKAGALTGMDVVYEESMQLTTMLLLDRNATVNDLDALMHDLARALTDPDVVIIVPGRGTTNTLTSVGQGSQMVEEGHRSYLKGLMALLGGSASESVGTGWGNILAVTYGRVLRALVDSHSAKMPLTSRMQRGSSFAVRAEGLIGFAPHAVGISEDIWAVCQTAHNSMALGRRVKFLLSTALWHKIRETWSHSEWLASFPRWSGGYLQMMHDPLMQRIVDFGPQSVFAKEVRANSGRNFLSAPFALLNILLLPLAIMLDVTPFIQILILLWNFGFVMNQILTVHGLNTYLEGAGFYRIPAFVGAILAGALPLMKPQLVPYGPGLILIGCLTGGFLVGLSRWLYTRVRDIILFGPQLVLHALGQVVRQSLEFVVSGASPEDAHDVNMAFRAWAGPREDRPLDGYPNFINLKTVIWLVGLMAIVLNLFALANLDMLNVLLLLPSLLFSVSMLLGPFIMRPRGGRALGKWAIVPQLLGSLAALAFFTAVSMLVAAGGWFNWAGLILFCAVFALLLRHGLKFILYRRQLARAKRKLTTLLSSMGTVAAESAKLAQRILQQALGSMANVKKELAVLPVEQQDAVLGLVERRIHPLLHAPMHDRERVPTARSRWGAEFGRTFALGIFILLWFFVVPVPGLLVFTAGAYRFSLGLGAILVLVLSAIAFVLLVFWIGKFLQWSHRIGSGRHAMAHRARQAFSDLQTLITTPTETARPELAGTFALFTDFQTYWDQRSYAYARRTLGMIETNLLRLSEERDRASARL